MISNEKAKEILHSGDVTYSDEQIKVILDYLIKLAKIEILLNQNIE
jgi:hypothetical protein